jgi:hypothetical protein
MDGNGRLPHNPLLCNRAIVGWYMSQQAAAGPQASGQYVAAYLCQHEGARYAVITTTKSGSISDQVHVLAVYLIGESDTLARLCHWPGEIEGY